MKSINRWKKIICWSTPICVAAVIFVARLDVRSRDIWLRGGQYVLSVAQRLLKTRLLCHIRLLRFAQQAARHRRGRPRHLCLHLYPVSAATAVHRQREGLRRAQQQWTCANGRGRRAERKNGGTGGETCRACQGVFAVNIYRRGTKLNSQTCKSAL